MSGLTLTLFICSFLFGCGYTANAQRNLNFSTLETVSWTLSGGIIGLGMSVGIWLIVTSW